MIISSLFLVLCMTTCLNAHYDIDDTLLYKIDFKPFSSETFLKSPVTTSQQDPAKENDEAVSSESSPTSTEENSLTDSVIITSVDKEKFRCQIPKVINLTMLYPIANDPLIYLRTGYSKDL